MWTKLDYIHQNPVKAGIVKKASDYLYSNASNYALDEGLIAIEMADNPVVDVLNLKNFTKYNDY